MFHRPSLYSFWKTGSCHHLKTYACSLAFCAIAYILQCHTLLGPCLCLLLSWISTAFVCPVGLPLTIPSARFRMNMLLFCFTGTPRCWHTILVHMYRLNKFVACRWQHCISVWQQQAAALCCHSQGELLAAAGMSQLYSPRPALQLLAYCPLCKYVLWFIWCILILLTHVGHDDFIVTLLGTAKFVSAVSFASTTACVKLCTQTGTKGKRPVPCVFTSAECYRGYGGAHLQVFPWYGVLRS